MKPVVYYVAVVIAAAGVASAAIQNSDTARGNTNVAGISHALEFVTPAKPHVLTVSEFLAQPAVREEVFARCANDPAGTRDDPNCINVRAAVRVALAGDGQIPNVIPTLTK